MVKTFPAAAASTAIYHSNAFRKGLVAFGRCFVAMLWLALGSSGWCQSALDRRPLDRSKQVEVDRYNAAKEAAARKQAQEDAFFQQEEAREQRMAEAHAIAMQQARQDQLRLIMAGDIVAWTDRPEYQVPFYKAPLEAKQHFGFGVYGAASSEAGNIWDQTVRERTGDAGRNTTSPSAPAGPNSRPKATGTGFFITEDGFAITNAHVVSDGTKFQLVTAAGRIKATVVRVDAANDIALLKAEGRFTPLAVTTSRAVRLGNTVATVGFPNVGLQGFAPKLAKGEVAAMSGGQDDPRYFQISVPVQPGNSGGALVDERGNIVGIVSAKLSAQVAFATSGALPENVNYAVKSSFLLGFLESVPAVAANLKEPNTKEAKFEDVVKSAEQATVLVLVY